MFFVNFLSILAFFIVKGSQTVSLFENMSRQVGQTPIAVRELIIKHFKDGKSVRKISGIVKKSHSTVHNIITRYKTSKQIENKKRQNSRKVLSDSNERYIIQQVKKNPFLSAPKLQELLEKNLKIKVCAETIRRTLRKYDLHGRVSRKKPFISVQNKTKRLEFAKLYKNKDFNFWRRVLFTDESKYNIFGSDGNQYVWRKSNEELRAKNLRPTVKHGGGSVMVWGSMSANGPGVLHFIEGNMDQHMYLDILKKNLPLSVSKLGIQNDYYFYQDNDPKHKAHKVRMWLLYNCPHVMETPPQSPDINVIENLWSYLENKIRQHQISNKSDLKSALMEEWEKIDPGYCKKLVESVPKRLKMVQENNGLHTKY